MTEKQTEDKYHQNFDIGYISKLDALTKLRIIVITIFILCTISIPLLIYGYIISAFLLIISYILVIVLMIKLMIIKKL
jgi:hypothetical protein